MIIAHIIVVLYCVQCAICASDNIDAALKIILSPFIDWNSLNFIKQWVHPLKFWGTSTSRVLPVWNARCIKNPFKSRYFSVQKSLVFCHFPLLFCHFLSLFRRDSGTPGLRDFGTSGLRDFGTSGLRDFDFGTRNTCVQYDAESNNATYMHATVVQMFSATASLPWTWNSTVQWTGHSKVVPTSCGDNCHVQVNNDR